MKRVLVWILVVSAVVAAIAGLLRLSRGGESAVSASVMSYLSGEDAAGFLRVTAPRPLRFPEDEGAHPGYQTEWWYYTGNLAGEDGRRFGFQLTFFRRALAPITVTAQAATRASEWATGQVYLAHFAVTDVAGGTYHSAERLARGSAGLAGAQADPFRVWVEGWEAVAAPLGRTRLDSATSLIATAETAASPTDDSSGPPIRLLARDDPAAIDLRLVPEKPPALHGDAGFSRKGPQVGNASYYFSYPRLGAQGVVTTTAGRFQVTGTAWMDHEWSTSALSAEQVGWDWFSLQLDDGQEVMAFQIREVGGAITPESGGSLIDADNRVTHFGQADFGLEVLDRWKSPRTGADYPAGWRLQLPKAGLDLRIHPLAADQELSVGFKYWEGAVEIEGTASGRPVAGHGYVELTGYAPAGVGLPGSD